MGRYVFRRQARYPVASVIFRRIQRFIDAVKQLINRFAIMMLGNANADGDRQRLIFADRLTDSLRHHQRAGDRRMRQKEQKLLASPAIYLIFAVHRGFQNAGDHQQDFIAFLMTVNIINTFEMIDID